MENNPNIQRVLVTGGAGFIGAHLIQALLEQTDWEVVVLDSFVGKGQYSRLDEIPLKNEDGTCIGYKIYHHDLRAPLDPVLCNRIGPIDVVFNIASNSAVERSVSDPVDCWHNNCDLIVNMLEYARPKNLQAFIHLSTDEVYGDYHHSNDDGFEEWSIINPGNPYAASKAAQEALCIAYWRTYDMPIVLVNTMNNIGERQDQEKFVPKIIASILQGKEVPIYTDNEGRIGSRVYLDVKDHVRFLLALANAKVTRYSKGYPTHLDRWNIAGKEEYDNLAIALKIARLIGKPLQHHLVPAKSARPGYDKRYLLNSGKFDCFLREHGIDSHVPLETTLKRIIKHIKEHPWWVVTDG